MKKSIQNEYIKHCTNLYNGFYDYSQVDYRGAHQHIKIICPSHGVFTQSPNNHKQGHGCQKCGKEKASKSCNLGTEKFIVKANLIHNNFYDYTKTNYISNKEHLLITCPLHGDFSQKAVRHLQGRHCPKCAALSRAVFVKSKGEIFVEEFLIINNIYYETQKQFENCNYKRPLSFDFYIPSYKMLIEFDGTQHVSVNSKFHKTNYSLIEYQKRDAIKDTFARKKNMKLVRIPYKGYKLKEHVESCLQKCLISC